MDLRCSYTRWKQLSCPRTRSKLELYFERYLFFRLSRCVRDWTDRERFPIDQFGYWHDEPLGSSEFCKRHYPVRSGFWSDQQYSRGRYHCGCLRQSNFHNPVCSRSHRRCWTSRSDLGGWWSSRLVATATEDGLNSRVVVIDDSWATNILLRVSESCFRRSVISQLSKPNPAVSLGVGDDPVPWCS